MAKVGFILIVYVVVVLHSNAVHGQGTRLGFYRATCPQVEFIVRSTVRSHFQLDPSIAPGLLRMHSHDCFVRGCDASVLLAGPNSERTAVPNRGRSWEVPTGRRDGRVSLVSEVKLPGFSDSIEVQKEKFRSMGLNTHDLVTLAGAHTIGTASCRFFSYRLYNFTTVTETGADPTLNPSLVERLRDVCPVDGDSSNRFELDIDSAEKFDVSFYKNLRQGGGILESDQMLWNDDSTRPIIQHYLSLKGLVGRSSFKVEFGRSMVKMSNAQVKTGLLGEIRRVCSKVNN
ncbi:hypothetical protein Csa_017313 [Cucumis sativus]|nr:hypothetical protein Csa_017313 [Cucumis sativus]